MSDFNTSLDEVVTIQVSTGGALIAEDNPNVCCLITSNTDVISTRERARVYKSAKAVENDFGTTSEEYRLANVFFGQELTPIGAGGYLVIGSWRSGNEVFAATSGKLVGKQLSEASTVSALQLVTDGSLKISIDSVEQILTNLDFSNATNLDEVVTIIDTALTDASATLVNNSIVITSDTTGDTSLVSYPIVNTTGTFIGNILGLATGTGAILVDGLATETLTLETKLASISAIKSVYPVKSFVFIDNPTDVESLALASYCQANYVTSFEVFEDSSNFTIDIANVCWEIKLKGYSNYRMLFDKGGDVGYSVAQMSRGHVVKFDGENTAMTLQLKQLNGVTPYKYSDSELLNAKKIGLDLYVTFKDVPKNLCGVGNDFFDNRYNLIALRDSIQTSYFNTLAGTQTKIPQTERGVLAIKDDITQSLKRFRKAGVIGTGLKWNGFDKFGDEATFMKNIEDEGFYILFQKLSEQLQVDRENRIAPVCQIAIKYAGAIHTGNVLVNIEK